MRFQRWLVAVALLLVTVPAWAQPAESTAREDTRESFSTAGSGIGWRGWGVRLGVTDDPDQVVGGAHFNLGEFVPNLRFQPDVLIGGGDDATTIFGTAPVYYHFDPDTLFTPYAGGGVSLGLVDRDLPGGDSDLDLEIGIRVTGGLEWPLRRGGSFLVELGLGFGDVADAHVVVGWTF